MYIINPQITIRKSNWFISLFKECVVVFSYAVEYSTASKRSCSEHQRTYYALDHVDALRIVNKLKASTRGMRVHVHDYTERTEAN